MNQKTRSAMKSRGTKATGDKVTEHKDNTHFNLELN